MNIDITKLKSDRRELEDRILEVKKELRSTWTRPMGALQVELLTLKKRVTALHILRAHLRGRIHLASQPERCQEIAERVAMHYQKEEAA